MKSECRALYGGRLGAMKLGVVLAVLAAAAMGQTAHPPAAATSPGPVKVYTNSELQLKFSYPAELAPQDTESTNAMGQRMVYGENTQTGPASGGAPPAACTKTLLAVGARPTKGNGLDASLTLFDIDLHCLPAKAMKSKSVMDTALRGFASQGVTELGMMPIGEAVRYELDGHRAYFASSQGTPVAKTDVQSGESEVMAVATVEANGHILAWMVESNDLNFFNRMLASAVDLGTGPAQPLFPAGIHAGDTWSPG